MKSVDLYAKRDDFYFDLSKKHERILLSSILLGVLVFIAGMLLGQQTRTWGSLLFNLLYFFSFTLGGVTFGHMQDSMGAVWGRPIKRLHESYGTFMPWVALLLALFLFCVRFDILGAKALYSWAKDPSSIAHFPGKNVWLQLDFMVLRDLFCLGILVALQRWQLKLSVGRDMALVAGMQAQAKEMGEKVQEKMAFWSPPIMVVQALCFSMIAFDLSMSLAPTWFSTLWAGWQFAVMMQTLMAMNLLWMFALKGTKLGLMIHRQQFHDVGKLMYGFSIFFAYLTFAHVLTYWYTNIPEETSYLITRLQRPWLYLTILIPIGAWLIPLFALIPKPAKWTAEAAVPMSLIILFCQWMSYLLVVMPEVVVDPSSWKVPWIEVGIFVGVLGSFLLCILKFGKKVPMLAIADPLLPAAYEHH